MKENKLIEKIRTQLKDSAFACGHGHNVGVHDNDEVVLLSTALSYFDDAITALQPAAVGLGCTGNGEDELTADVLRHALVRATGSLGLLIKSSGSTSPGHAENYAYAKKVLGGTGNGGEK